MARAPSSEVPDTVLPVQYFTRTAVSDTPEKRLIFAVLMDAIVELKRSDGQGAVDAHCLGRYAENVERVRKR